MIRCSIKHGEIFLIALFRKKSMLLLALIKGITCSFMKIQNYIQPIFATPLHSTLYIVKTVLLKCSVFLPQDIVINWQTKMA